MNEDQTARSLRVELVSCVVERVIVAILYDHDGEECAVAGRVVRVNKTHAAIQTSRSFESAIPVAAITNIRRLNEPKETANVETKEG